MQDPKKPERKPGETDSDFSARIEAWIVRLEAAKEKARKYYTENAERIREQRRKRRAEHLAQLRERDREYIRKYRAENAERIREQRRKYYAENAEKFREYMRKYYAENAERERERSRKYRTENAERIRGRERKYRAKHAEQRRERHRKWYAENVEHVREYRTENAARIREQLRKYRAENAEKFREYMRKYRTEHLEQCREYAREYARKYCAENAEQRRERERERYAKKLGLSRAEYLKTIRHARGVKASLGEAVVCCYLESAGIKFEREKTFDWLRNSETGRRFRCDFYLPDLGTVIEYNGPQHYGYRMRGCSKPEDIARRMVMDVEKAEKITARGLRFIAIPGDEIRKAGQIRLYLARELASDGRADSK